MPRKSVTELMQDLRFYIDKINIALIQSYFDYAYSAWYPNFSKRLKKQNSNVTE